MWHTLEKSFVQGEVLLKLLHGQVRFVCLLFNSLKQDLCCSRHISFTKTASNESLGCFNTCHVTFRPTSNEGIGKNNEFPVVFVNVFIKLFLAQTLILSAAQFFPQNFKTFKQKVMLTKCLYTLLGGPNCYYVLDRLSIMYLVCFFTDTTAIIY